MSLYIGFIKSIMVVDEIFVEYYYAYFKLHTYMDQLTPDLEN
jgi:hypothetical protein